MPTAHIRERIASVVLTRCCAFLATGLLLVASPLKVSAADEPTTLDDLLQSTEQWAKENLDDDALRVFQNLDREKVRQVLDQVQKQFHGEYVIDLGALRESAKQILPLLESYQDTLPYALLLKTRLDYLDVAEEFRLTIPPPKTKPNEPPRPPPNPAPQLEREVWVKKLKERPWPEH